MSGARISIVVPTRNGGRAFADLCRHLAQLRQRFALEVLIIDSDSHDATREDAQRAGLRVRRIAAADFGHGRTRNLGVQLTSGDIICFLTQDVLPCTPDWPLHFASALAAPGVAGVYGRQVPRDARAMEMFFVALNYPSAPMRFDPRPGGHHPRPGRVLFSNAFSAVRRDVALRVPFAEDAPVSEDQIWAHQVLAAGYSITYQPAAEALHAHSYSLRGLFRRTYLVGRALRAIGLDGGASFGESVRFLGMEFAYFTRQGHTHRLPQLLAYEVVRWAGFQVGRQAPGRRIAPVAAIATTEDPESHTATAHLVPALRAHSARGSAVSLLAQGLKFAMSFAATIVLARLLTPADFGLVAMVVAVTGFVGLFRELGLATATVQAPSISVREVSTLFWINLAIGLLLVCATVAVAPVIAWFYQDPRLAGIGFLLAPMALFRAAGCQHRALLRRQMRFSALGVIDIVAFAVGVAAALFTAWRGGGYWALVVFPLATEAAAMVGVWAANPWRPGRPAPVRTVRGLLAFGGNITGFEVVNYWARNIDNLLLGRFWGAYPLGLYAKAYQLVMMPLELVSGPVGTVATSGLSRLATESPQRYRQSALATIQKIALLTMPVAVLIVGAADWIVLVVLGPQWGAAAPLLAVLGVAAFTQPIGHTAGWILITQGRSRDLLHWGLIGGGIATASIVAGVPWGAMGVAVSYVTVGLVVRTPLLFWFVGRRGSVTAADYARSVAMPVSAALAALVAVTAFRRLAGPVPPGVGLLGAALVVGSVTLAVVALLPGGRRALGELAQLVSLAVRGERMAT